MRNPVRTDIILPGVDGYARIRAIRERAGFATLPIIAVAANAVAEVRDKCLKSAVGDDLLSLSQPIDNDQLASAIAAGWRGDHDSRTLRRNHLATWALVSRRAIRTGELQRRSRRGLPTGNKVKPESLTRRGANIAVTAKILIVDDTPANLVAMRQSLACSGAQLFEAATGRQALALCRDHDFALILLDVNVPDMDGFEVAGLIGETEHLRDTPIIFVTAASADDMNQLKGYRSGAVDYIARPINDVILQSKVKVFLELYGARAKLQHALADLAERNQQLTREVAERERVEAVVRHQATHDPLTDLPNRTLFHDRLRGAIQRADRHQNRFALAYLDIDDFKEVNDSHGHAAGDMLLQEIAARLSSQLRANDTVARLGGDEFALILEEIESSQAALKLCEKVSALLAEPYRLHVGDKIITAHVGASIGIVPYLPTGRADTDEKLMHGADDAMYEAKRTGKNRCVLAD